MEQTTKYLPLYFDNEEALYALSDEDLGALVKALLDHAQGRIVGDLNPTVRIAYILLANGIDRQARRYAANVENGKKGGAPRKNNNPSITQNNPTITQLNPSATDYEPSKDKRVKSNNSISRNSSNLRNSSISPDSSKESVQESINSADKPRRFTKPTVEDISAYCKERGNTVNPQQFFDFYEAKGWYIGKNPMKDWKAAVRTWEQKDGERKPKQFTAKEDKYDANSKDYSTSSAGIEIL